MPRKITPEPEAIINVIPQVRPTSGNALLHPADRWPEAGEKQNISTVIAVIPRFWRAILIYIL